MKNIFTILILIFASISLYAQRNVEKTENVSANDRIALNFKFADEIKVQQWDKKEVAVKATVQIDDGEGNESYSLKTERDSGTVKISSDFGDYFKKKHKRNNWNDCNTTTEIDYVVYVPRNSELKVKSISGDLFLDSFSGSLVTDLISGDVEIKKYSGELRLKTISGDLDITMNKARIDAKTLTGTIYSDLDIDTEGSKKRSSGSNRVKGTVNNGGDWVELETISGNIYMRKG